ncbi:MAG: hypothetical protein U9O98_07205 [Asgard group archaeon]|nr:hypothetical protein [Asgard group archaeon]
MKVKSKIYNLFTLVSVLILVFPQIAISGYTFEQEFTLSNETKVYLDEEEDSIYNGSVQVFLETGATITVTVNNQTGNIEESQNKTFLIDNTSSLFFQISTEGNSEGYFIFSLNVNPGHSDRNPLYIALGIVLAVLILLGIVSHYIRANRLKKEPDEKDVDLVDPETERKRQESAGAEKRYWGKE